MLAKQWRGSTKSDQYWGDSMVPARRLLPTQLRSRRTISGSMSRLSVTCQTGHIRVLYDSRSSGARSQRAQAEEAEQEKERHARVKASQRKERAARGVSPQHRRRCVDAVRQMRVRLITPGTMTTSSTSSHRTGRRALPPNDSRSSWLEMLGRLDWNAVALVHTTPVTRARAGILGRQPPAARRRTGWGCSGRCMVVGRRGGERWWWERRNHSVPVASSL